MASLKLETKNPNYAATVVRIHNLVPLAKCDNIVGFPIFGFQAIVSKSTEVGQIGILFTAETQLSPDFAKNNNLHRHSELNKDEKAVGYLEDTRRVKAIKLRGHESSALFLPLSSLSYLNIDTNQLKEGDSFDSINGIQICTKYKIKHQKSSEPKNKQRGNNKKFERVEGRLFPEHIDTENYFKNSDKIKEDEYIVVTQKGHGTSGRFGNILVKRKLNLIEKVLKKLGVKITETEYDYISGSRRVIKDAKSEREYNHYYASDIWNDWLEKIKFVIPKNYIIYGEIIGWIGDKKIQDDYAYGLPQGESELFIYRISIINEDGIHTDLSWPQIKQFCNNNGLKYVPEIYYGKHKDFDVSKYIDVKYVKDLGLKQCLPLDPESPCDEGVCIRLEALTPYILKAKSPMFFAHETKQMDKGVVDLESSQTEEDNAQ